MSTQSLPPECSAMYTEADFGIGIAIAIILTGFAAWVGLLLIGVLKNEEARKAKREQEVLMEIGGLDLTPSGLASQKASRVIKKNHNNSGSKPSGASNTAMQNPSSIKKASVDIAMEEISNSKRISNKGIKTQKTMKNQNQSSAEDLNLQQIANIQAAARRARSGGGKKKIKNNEFEKMAQKMKEKKLRSQRTSRDRTASENMRGMARVHSAGRKFKKMLLGKSKREREKEEAAEAERLEEIEESQEKIIFQILVKNDISTEERICLEFTDPETTIYIKCGTTNRMIPAAALDQIQKGDALLKVNVEDESLIPEGFEQMAIVDEVNRKVIKSCSLTNSRHSHQQSEGTPGKTVYQIFIKGDEYVEHDKSTRTCIEFDDLQTTLYLKCGFSNRMIPNATLDHIHAGDMLLKVNVTDPDHIPDNFKQMAVVHEVCKVERHEDIPKHREVSQAVEEKWGEDGPRFSNQGEDTKYSEVDQVFRELKSLHKTGRVSEDMFLSSLNDLKRQIEEDAMPNANLISGRYSGRDSLVSNGNATRNYNGNTSNPPSNGLNSNANINSERTSNIVDFTDSRNSVLSNAQYNHKSYGLSTSAHISNRSQELEVRSRNIERSLMEESEKPKSLKIADAPGYAGPGFSDVAAINANLLEQIQQISAIRQNVSKPVVFDDSQTTQTGLVPADVRVDINDGNEGRLFDANGYEYFLDEENEPYYIDEDTNERYYLDSDGNQFFIDEEGNHFYKDREGRSFYYDETGRAFRVTDNGTVEVFELATNDDLENNVRNTEHKVAEITAATQKPRIGGNTDFNDYYRNTEGFSGFKAEGQRSREDIQAVNARIGGRG